MYGPQYADVIMESVRCVCGPAALLSWAHIRARVSQTSHGEVRLAAVLLSDALAGRRDGVGPGCGWRVCRGPRGCSDALQARTSSPSSTTPTPKSTASTPWSFHRKTTTWSPRRTIGEERGSERRHVADLCRPRARSVLSLNQLIEHSDCVLPIENQARYPPVALQSCTN